MRIFGVRFIGSVIAVRYTARWRVIVGFSSLLGLLCSPGVEQSSSFWMLCGTARNVLARTSTWVNDIN